MSRRDDEFNRQYLACEAWLAERVAELLAEDREAAVMDQAASLARLEFALANLTPGRRMDAPTRPEGIAITERMLDRVPLKVEADLAERGLSVADVHRQLASGQGDLGLNGEVRALDYQQPRRTKPKQPSANPAARGGQAATLFEIPEEKSP